MKEFMKVCAILALVLIAVGVLLGVTSQSVHGGPVSLGEIVDSVTHGESTSRLGNWGESFLNELDEINYDINDHIIFDNDREVMSGDVARYALESSESVRELDIKLGGCALSLAPSLDNKCYIEAKNAGNFQVYVEGNTLCLKSLTGTDKWNEVEKRRLTLYIPESILWSEVDVELGAGLIEFGEMTAKEVCLEVGAGMVTGELLRADELDIDVGAGSVELADVQTRHLEANVSAGNLIYVGDITSEAELKCSVGNIEMKLEGAEKDYNYELRGTMGNMTVGGQDYRGLGNRKVQDNGASKRIDAECSLGNIEIKFGG